MAHRKAMKVSITISSTHKFGKMFIRNLNPSPPLDVVSRKCVNYWFKKKIVGLKSGA